MDRIIMITLLLIGAFFLATYLLWRFSKGKLAIVCMPTFVALVLTIYNLYIAKTGSSENFERLGGFVYGIMFFIAFLVSLGTVLYLVNRKNKKLK
jgi:hypothetical protein